MTIKENLHFNYIIEFQIDEKLDYNGLIKQWICLK